jgi:predicted TIM-barrel fold metal-dependent hydrolase
MNVLDVHAHFVPDLYREALHAVGHAQPDGFPAIPQWSADEHVEALDRLGIRTALLSISSPGVHFGDHDAAAELARTVNEAGRRAVDAHPGRFGLLAALPIPDVGGALAEIRYAFDELRADGIALLTNVAGTYLGDPVLEPVFDELDRRHARVLLHPTSPACWEHTSLGRPRPMIEFLFDTTRAVTNLVLNGTVARHPNIAFVIPHAGAALPAIADRVAAFSAVLGDVDPASAVERDLAGLHYDLAGFPLPRQLDALLTLTTIEHLHYGSDYPFTPEPVVRALADRLDQHDRHDDAPGGLLAQLTTNTQRLFARFG